jgi:hypothetical protein
MAESGTSVQRARLGGVVAARLLQIYAGSDIAIIIATLIGGTRNVVNYFPLSTNLSTAS